MSYEAWGTPPEAEPKFCPVCDSESHIEGCELGEMQKRAFKAERQRDELLAAAERQFEADYALINMPFNCTKQEHEAALEEHTNSHEALAKVIASVKDGAA